jgi:uncharacterized protein YjdB
MKKLSVLFVMLTVLAVLFSGCPQPTDDDGDGTPEGSGGTPKVTGVTITKGGSPVSDALSVATGGYIELGAAVLPAGASNADKAVTWSSSTAEIATVNAAGRVEGVSVGTAVITVTTAGKKENGQSATATVTVNVTVPVKVAGVTIKLGEADADDSIDLPANGSLTLTAVVTPDNVTTADKTVSWTSNNPGVASVADGVVTWVATGTAVITVTTAGKNEAGEDVTDSVTINAKGAPKLALSNQGTPAGETTTALTLNGANRYVIRNDMSTAKVDAKLWENVDNTIVYLDTPLTGDFTFSARVRITETIVGISNANGIFVGALVNPGIKNEELNSGQSDAALAKSMYFAGLRSVNNNQKAMYISRDNQTTNAGTGNVNWAGEDNSSNASWVDSINKLYTPDSQLYEYIYTISRTQTVGETTTAEYTLEIKNTKTGEVLLTGRRNNNATGGNGLHKALAAGPVYPGFIISGVAVELSDIVITEGSTPIYQSPEAGYTSVPATAVTLSVDGVEPAGEFDYVGVLADVPSGGVQVKPAFTPVNSTSDLTWTVSSGTNGTVDTSGLVTITGAGDFTVKAAVSPEIYAEYKFRILADVLPVTAVTVSGPSEVNVGFKITLAAEVAPVGADPGVFWYSSDNTKATINTTTGELTGVAPGTVTVTAKSFSGADDAEVSSAGHTVTVKALSSNTIFSWSAAADAELANIASGDHRTMGDPSATATAVSRVVTAVTEGTKAYRVTNGRFVIGSADTTASTGAAYASDGEFDLSSAARLTVVYASSTGTGFQIYLNNNTSSAANSPLGDPASRIWNGTEVAGGVQSL